MNEIRKLKQDVEVLRGQTGIKKEDVEGDILSAILGSLTAPQQGFFIRALVDEQRIPTEAEVKAYLVPIWGQEKYDLIISTRKPISPYGPPEPARAPEKWRAEDYP